MTMLDPGSFELPPIPTKRYFTIGEVSALCEVKPHVLRYWEQEFPQLRPLKRRGNRRYYQRHEVKLIRQIRKLLYGDGFTISGARLRLAQLAEDEKQGGNEARAGAKRGAGRGEGNAGKVLRQLIAELEEVGAMLK